MNNLTKTLFAAALGTAIAAPTFAASNDSLVDEIKNNVLINNPADKVLEHFATHSEWAGSQVEIKRQKIMG